MNTRPLELTISLANLEAQLVPFLNATKTLGYSEDIIDFEFVKFDTKTGTFTFKAEAQKNREGGYTLH